MDDFTVVELLDRAADRIRNTPSDRDGAGREFAIALTAIEDAQMRFTRGLAKQTDRFHPGDLEK